MMFFTVCEADFCIFLVFDGWLGDLMGKCGYIS